MMSRDSWAVIMKQVQVSSVVALASESVGM